MIRQLVRVGLIAATLLATAAGVVRHPALATMVLRWTMTAALIAVGAVIVYAVLIEVLRPLWRTHDQRRPRWNP